MKTNFSKVLSYTGLIGSVLTIAGLIIAIIQLSNSNSTRNADFAHRLKTDFFTDQTMYLFMLIDQDLIQFKTVKVDTNEFGYFEIDTARAQVLNHLNLISGKKIFTAYEVENYVLNHLDDLGEFYKRGIIDLEYVNDGFSYYIDHTYENKEIQKYLKWIEPDVKEKKSYAYDNFEYIYRKLKLYNGG
jgi:hypothetical protein